MTTSTDRATATAIVEQWLETPDVGHEALRISIAHALSECRNSPKVHPDRAEAMVKRMREYAKDSREDRANAPNFADDYRRGLMVGRAYHADLLEEAAKMLETMILA